MLGLSVTELSFTGIREMDRGVWHPEGRKENSLRKLCILFPSRDQA